MAATTAVAAPRAPHPATTRERGAVDPGAVRRFRRGVSVLDVDPDLGQWLDDGRRAAAARELVGAPLALEMSEWDVASVMNAGPAHVGLLVVEGFLVRESLLRDGVSSELVGPGDLLRPWDDGDAFPRLLTVETRWNVLSPSRLVVLDSRFAARLRDYPEVMAALFARLHQRSQRLTTAKAISQLTNVERRLVALLWHLAERWGVVTPDGVVIPLTLSHRLLSQMVGAQRPTISTAVARLASRGEVIRRADGTWLLPTHVAPDLTPRHPPVVHTRRRLCRMDDSRSELALS